VPVAPVTSMRDDPSDVFDMIRSVLHEMTMSRG